MDEIEDGLSPKGNMWSAVPVALLCMVLNQNERKKGDFSLFVRLSIHSYICLSPQALSGLKCALLRLKSTHSGHESERADLRPERLGFRPERADFRPVRAWGDERANKQKEK